MSGAVIGASDVVTAYGWGMPKLWQGLLSNKTAITPCSLFPKAQFEVNLAAQVPELTAAANQSRIFAMLEKLLAPLVGTLDEQTPLILATTVGEVEYVQQAAEDDGVANPANASLADPQVLLQRVKKLLGLQGKAWVMSSACASSTAAVGMAAAMVEHQETREVLVVAADALSEFVFSGFSALSSLSEQPAKPFDLNRDGLSLGESAAWLLVSSSEHHALVDTTDQPVTTLAGWGSSSDATHMTAPDPKGSGLQRAIAKACHKAGCQAEDCLFTAAHGTATLYSDAMEMAALSALMTTPSPVFSIKGGIGHTLGAAGLVQLLVAHEALTRSIVPPTVGLVHPDHDAIGRASSNAVMLQGNDQGKRFALSINSGFGGVNSAMVLSQECR